MMPQPAKPPKNINFAPTSISLSTSSVAENDAGAVIGTLSAQDPNTGDKITLTVVDSSSPFEAIQVKGKWVLKLKSDVSLDYEALGNGTTTVQVRATDSGGLSKVETFTIQ